MTTDVSGEVATVNLDGTPLQKVIKRHWGDGVIKYYADLASINADSFSAPTLHIKLVE
jgi:hypothetical protein